MQVSFFPSWALAIEWVNWIHESYDKLIDSSEEGCGPEARFSLCEGCAHGLGDQRCEPQCESFVGFLRDLCKYCDDDSLMPVSHRDEADSVDSAVYGIGGCDLELAPREQQSVCWSVFSEYEEESACFSGCRVPAAVKHVIEVVSLVLQERVQRRVAEHIVLVPGGPH